MRKLTMIVVVLFTTYAFSQKASKDYTFFEKSNQTSSVSEGDLESAPAPPGDPAPIDDYIPLLAAAGIGMAVYFGRKKQILTK